MVRPRSRILTGNFGEAGFQSSPPVLIGSSVEEAAPRGRLREPLADASAVSLPLTPNLTWRQRCTPHLTLRGDGTACTWS